MMIDRTILRQMGFRESDDPAWGHEVWYHLSECLVHYGSDQQFEIYSAYYSNRVAFNGDSDTMEHFFEAFIKNVENGARWSATSYEED
jgi:hypothetical protein